MILFTIQAPTPLLSPPFRWLLLLVLATRPLHISNSAAQENSAGNKPPVYGYRIVNTYPHDRTAFCQGLVFADGVLYEGTGQYGRSTLRKVDLRSGKVLQLFRMNPRLFGEGITIHGNDLIQLTWRSRAGYVYDKQTFKPRTAFRYTGEGWGITSDGQQLIMSDGSATLRFLDPKTYQVTRRVVVRSQGRPVDRLNELEYIEGAIYANVWETDYIARISPQTGEVLGWIDLRGLLGPLERLHPDAVLNGIAYDAKGKRLFVTGKFWPKLFEIKLVPRG